MTLAHCLPSIQPFTSEHAFSVSLFPGSQWLKKFSFDWMKWERQSSHCIIIKEMTKTSHESYKVIIWFVGALLKQTFKESFILTQETYHSILDIYQAMVFVSGTAPSSRYPHNVIMSWSDAIWRSQWCILSIDEVRSNIYSKILDYLRLVQVAVRKKTRANENTSMRMQWSSRSSLTIGLRCCRIDILR